MERYLVGHLFWETACLESLEFVWSVFWNMKDEVGCVVCQLFVSYPDVLVPKFQRNSEMRDNREGER